MATRRPFGALPAALLLATALVVMPPTGTVSAGATSLATAPAPRGWTPVVPVNTAEAQTAANGRCSDSAGTWLGMRWRSQLRWRLNSTTVPTYLGTPDAVVAAAQGAAATVDQGRNDCGLTERLGTRQRYVGDTTKRAGVDSSGGCRDRDGTNTVSFGELAAGLLAVTCIWWYGGKQGGRSVEADILVDDAGGLFFLSTPANCAGRWDLESTLTHEFGHAFGLGHVPYAEHGTLTMSDGLPDCSTAYRSLGLGDYQTLAAHYGSAN